MEPVKNNKNEERARHARAARIEQMRREKQLQEQRRRMIKKLLPKAAGALGVLIIIIVAVVNLGGKKDENETRQQAQTQDSAVQSGTTEMPEDSAGQSDMTEMPEDSVVQSGTDETVGTIEKERSENPADATGESTFTANIGTIISNTTGEKITPVYNFETTSDSVTINSEEVISTNAILVDAGTDTIIASKGAYDRISPASMTKVLTVLVAAEHISKEDLDDTFIMTTEITDYAFVNDCSAVGFLKDEEVTVRDLFYGTVLPSGADAAVGLATYVAGSQEAFVDMMNEKLDALGLSDSAHFTNCVGLYDANHYCTVYDMAVIMKAAMQNELCREVLSKHIYTTTPTTEHPEGIEMSNWFLRRIEDKDAGGEVLCAKTGYVVQSQNCAVSYGTFADGVPYICVTAGATSSWRCIYDHVEIYNQYVRA